MKNASLHLDSRNKGEMQEFIVFTKNLEKSGKIDRESGKTGKATEF